MQIARHNAKHQAVSGYAVLGIDPAKANHHGVILDGEGVQQGKSFSFEVSYSGFGSVWSSIKSRLSSYGPEDMPVAVEASCNLWCSVANYFDSKGYTVVLVKPMLVILCIDNGQKGRCIYKHAHDCIASMKWSSWFIDRSV